MNCQKLISKNKSIKPIDWNISKSRLHTVSSGLNLQGTRLFGSNLHGNYRLLYKWFPWFKSKGN